MEKGPQIRIIGGASSEKKEQAKKEIEQAFFNHFESLSTQEKEQFEKFEYPKSDKEIALIKFANEETSRLMREAGIEPYDVPVENFHIIPPDLYNKVSGDNGSATTYLTKQGIIFDAQYFRDNPVYFGAVALHELLHLKAHFSMEVQEDGDEINITPYREGVAVRALQSDGYHNKYHHHFAGLHEGIVTETEKRLLEKLLDSPELAQENEWLTSEEAREKRKNLATEEDLPENDIIWIGKKGKDDWEQVSYINQRAVLNYVCAEIQKQLPGQHKNTDDVYKAFLNAHFTGRLLPIARLVEETFGEGSFRLLGNMDTNDQSGVLHLESLKKARGRQIKTAGASLELEQADSKNNLQKYLENYLDLKEGDVEKIRLITVDDLPINYQKQLEAFNDQRLSNITIAIIPDNLWVKGSQPSESDAEKGLISVKQSYFEASEKPDEIAWLTHEFAHCQNLFDSESPDDYEKNMQTQAFSDLKLEGTYPNNIVEQQAFSKQFNFLKDQGNSREAIIKMISEYYDQEDMPFFDKLLDNIYGE